MPIVNTSPAQPKILIVDDTPANLFAMRRLLSQADAQIVEATSGNEALALCLDQHFALILLDVNMPDMDGYEVAALLDDEPLNRETPVIFVTAAYADDLNRLKGYRSGAVDYIAKPVNDMILLSKVKVFLELHASRMRLTYALASLEERNRQLSAEVAERRRVEAKIRHLATHDMLTSLPNRALFIDTLDKLLENKKGVPSHFAVLYIDIDGFKAVNDNYGHQAGDALLQIIGQRLRRALRSDDVVARLGGDEFSAILAGVADPDIATSKCDELCKLLRAPYHLPGTQQGVTAEVSASIGVALYPLHGSKRDSLIQLADDAMYEAKRSGKNHSRLANPSLKVGDGLG